MPTQVIFSISLNDVRPVIYYGQTVFSRSAIIKSILGSHLGEEYKQLLADPYISDDALAGRSDASWLSSFVSPQAVPLSRLSPEQQQIHKSKLLQMLEQIYALADNLLASPSAEQKQQGEILKKAVEIPGFDYVLVENNKLVMVCWGFSSEVAEKTKFQIYKAIKAENIVIPKEEQAVIKETKEENDIPVQENNIVKDNLPVEQKTIEQKQPIDEIKTPITPQVNTIDNNPPVQTATVGKKRRFPWWILLLILVLLILLLLIFLSRKFLCNKPFLPDIPNKYAPIDPGKIIPDPNDRFKRPVVGNRLIISLKKNGQYKNVYEFARIFNDDFSGEGCTIVAYDTIAKTISIEFPAEKRLDLKQKIKNKYKDILIIDEAIFNNKFLPTDAGFSEAEKSWAFKIIRAFEGWDITKGSSDVCIAIIDNGFDPNHTEFKGRIKETWNVVSYNTNVNTGSVNMTHGTHVAGIAAAGIDNNLGVSGIAPNCQLMLIQIADQQGNMSTGSIINGILYAINKGADVINMSLGMELPENMRNFSQAEQEQFIANYNLDEAEFWNELFTYANENNVTIILAGGNSNVLIGIDPMARTQQTIQVSAVDPELKKAEFSNYGKFSHISAPGVHIYNTFPNNKFAYLDGTSMAAPIITGAAALAKSLNKDITTEEIRTLMVQTGIQPVESNKSIGRVLQLDAFLNAVKTSSNSDCSKIKLKIDSLKQVIENLEKKCNKENQQLKIPENAKDIKFAEGKWKASNEIVNEKKERVQVYFEFTANGGGKMILHEPDGNVCSGEVKLSLQNGKMLINQLETAKCKDGKFFQKYDFDCSPEKDGVARCFAKNQQKESNTFNFTLFRQ